MGIIRNIIICGFLLSVFSACAQKPKDDKIKGYRMSRLTGNMEFYNSKNEKIVEYPFSNITLDEKELGFYTVGTLTKRGIMTDRGVMVVDTLYEWLGIIDMNLAIVYDKSKYGLIDFKGKIIVPVIYDDITEAKTPGCFEVKKDGKSGIMNKEGKFISPLK
ncbi:WG repeat-containing protein [Pedobacter caeni]|uniref:WG containing repeat-containing protein n=1 Tax=Pedobacter caeni TaxID=288992 RepID=A0A1M4UBI1_9SPHI|nr:WG repeat-containing protein [Pedobacter caeni]SHE54085.1 WG containing repeat-containing protein [Pedobacter caeni]